MLLAFLIIFLQEFLSHDSLIILVSIVLIFLLSLTANYTYNEYTIDEGETNIKINRISF